MSAESYSKVCHTHLEGEAFLYVRQSTLRQVFENTESTKRQYALRDRAIALGWPLDRIRVIDNDLGRSGAHAEGREGFQYLVAQVAMGRAGIVMGLEVSRLARNSADWHRLIELCAMTSTLILDEDGIYDPAQFNDRLLLGLKGTMSEAELHILKARLRGGILNKARRGELQMRPPIGLVYRPDGRIDLDPDQQIRDSIQLLFHTFEREGSATQIVRSFRRQGILIPRRLQSGANKGEIIWGPLDHARVLQVLHNPRYAGAFVFGRTKTRPLPGGGYAIRKVARDQWQVLLTGAHPGYISWDQFEANQRRLTENAHSLAFDRKGGAPREGSALLQGRVVCGHCGKRMSVRYEQQVAGLVPIYVCQRNGIARAEGICQSVPGKVVDPAISELLLETVAPSALELALAVQAEIEQRLTQTDALLHQHVERAQYEADLARRRYLRIDPDNRLVADQLESDWNGKLRAVQEAQDEYHRQSQAAHIQLDESTRAKVLALASDFPRVWNDPATPQRERKRMLALLIEDVTLVGGKIITVNVQLRGGQTRTLTVARPRPIAQIRKTAPDVLAEIERLLETLPDRDVVSALQSQGYRTWNGGPFTLRKLFHLRQAYGLKSHSIRLRENGFLTTTELAQRFDVSSTTINNWGRQGLLTRRICEHGHRCVYDPIEADLIIKGNGGRNAKPARRITSQRT